MWWLVVACTAPEPTDPVSTGDTMRFPSTNEDGPTVEQTAAVLRQALTEALPNAPAGVTGMTLWVVDHQGERLIDETVGDFAPQRRVAVASASKLVSALVVLRTLDQTDLDLDTPLGVAFAGETDALGNPLVVPDPLDAVTLDELGGFVSGLPGDVGCTFLPGSSLDACVDSIVALPLEGPPGLTFDYGSTHQHLLGRAVELATGGSWSDAFDDLKADLGLTDPDLRYVTLPQQAIGGDNPLIAGGLRASVAEYAMFLEPVLQQGISNFNRVVQSDGIERLYENRYPDATMLTWPMNEYGFDFRYGFGTWLECKGPVSQCSVLSSPGAFGFTPWVDQGSGYFAILGMESEGVGGAGFAVPLAQTLKPPIEAMMKARNAE